MLVVINSNANKASYCLIVFVRNGKISIIKFISGVFMNIKLVNKCKEFLVDFSDLTDTPLLEKQLNEISYLICKEYKVPEQALPIKFVESKKFGMSGVLEDDKIIINKLRLKTLIELKFDDTEPTKLKKFINTFELEYKTKEKPNMYETILYDYIQMMKEAQIEEYIYQSGSYKTIKYDLLSMLFHENAHIKQKTFEQYLINYDKLPNNTENLILLFTMLYNHYNWSLIEKEIIPFENHENYRFPIEFDARYHELTKMFELYINHCQDDKLMMKYINNLILLPENFNSKSESIKLFEELEKYHKLYNNASYEKTFLYLKSHKRKIINYLTKRFNIMQNIKAQTKFK